MMKTTAHNRIQKGFSLIELLVVIAIIMILAAILLPVFESAQAKARQTQCLSNMKQIGSALMQYVQDYDGVYPVNNQSYVYTMTNPAGGYNSDNIRACWMQDLYAYTKTEKVFDCEDKYGKNTVIAYPANGPSVPIYPMYALGANQWIVGAGDTAAQTTTTVPESKVGKPEQLPIVADSLYQDFSDGAMVANASWFYYNSASSNSNGSMTWWYYQYTTYNGNTYDGLTMNPKYSRHTGGSNVIYGDGHAKWVTQGAIFWLPTNLKTDGVTRCGSTVAAAGSGGTQTCWGLPLDPLTDPRLK